MLDSGMAWLPSGRPTDERAQRGTAEVVRAGLTVSRKTANPTIHAEKADAVAGLPSAVWTAFDRSKKGSSRITGGCGSPDTRPQSSR